MSFVLPQQRFWGFQRLQTGHDGHHHSGGVRGHGGVPGGEGHMEEAGVCDKMSNPQQM